MDYPFTKCLNPLELYDSRHNKIFVNCGKCVACQNTKRSALSLKLCLEEQNSKYCYFVTLTYDDDNLPLFTIGWDTLLSGVCRLYNSSQRLIDDKDINEFCSDYFVGSSEFFDSIDYYNSFVSRYENKYHKSCVYGHGSIALLYYRDIQLFLKRLRKFINKYYNEKIRYYVIGEYGTKSLRPHWHLLLFFNSSSLSQAFEDCENVGTPERPCECPVFLRPLWEFGIVDSKRTNGECYNYVSSYVNKSSYFPKLLILLCDQKAYHSIGLGQILSEESIIEHIKKDDFRFFDNQFYLDSSGAEIPFALWRSYYDKYFPQFTSSSCMSLEETYRVLTSFETLSFIYRSDSPSVLARDVFRHFHMSEPDFHDVFKYIRYAYNMTIHANNVSLCSCLTQVISASKKFLKSAHLCGCSPCEYFRKYCKFYKYKNLTLLSKHFENCEDSVYRSLYYSTYLGSSLDKGYMLSPEFSDFSLSEKVRFTRSIKHRDVVAETNVSLNLI